jgi:hypothetical protein
MITTLKKRIFNIVAVCLTGFFICIAVAASAQEKKRHWLLPDHASLQYAGGIGFISGGIGYANKKGKLVTDIMFGYVPKSIGGDNLHLATAKFAYWPIKPIGKRDLQVKPLGLGILANYSFGKQYFSFYPDHYRFDYYDHPTSLHGAVFISSALQTKLNNNKSIRQWQLYYELLTYDVELISYLGNKDALGVKDILTMGIGVRAKF